jgi:N-acetylglucosamine-6-phosphate deacetylase
MPIDAIDLQVNGCFGVDFNSDDLTEEAFALACEKLASTGTKAFLATIITDALNVMCQRIKRLATFIRSSDQANPSRSQCIGIHVEGPFLSQLPGYIGAHPVAHARLATLDEAKRIVDAGDGLVKLFTLAPECDSTGQATRFLSDAGIIVSVGHSDASLDDLHRAIDHGLQMITHFGNACPQVLPRHDNVLMRQMSLPKGLYVGLIADSHHLPLWMLPMLVSHFGDDRVIVVSDAMSAAGLGPGTYRLGSRSIDVGPDQVARDAVHGNFVGSTSLLADCERHIRSLKAFDEEQVTKMFRINALQLLSSK